MQGYPLFDDSQIAELQFLVRKLKSGGDPISEFLKIQLPSQALQVLRDPKSCEGDSEGFASFIRGLNQVLAGPCLFDYECFKQVRLRPETLDFIKQRPKDSLLIYLNRMILEDAFPNTKRGPIKSSGHLRPYLWFLIGLIIVTFLGYVVHWFQRRM